MNQYITSAIVALGLAGCATVNPMDRFYHGGVRIQSASLSDNSCATIDTTVADNGNSDFHLQVCGQLGEKQFEEWRMVGTPRWQLRKYAPGIDCSCDPHGYVNTKGLVAHPPILSIFSVRPSEEEPFLLGADGTQFDLAFNQVFDKYFGGEQK